MIQNTYLRKYITSQCSKLSACLSLIQSTKLVIMFLIPVVLVDFRGRFEHVFASLQYFTSVHIKKESRLVGYFACEEVGGGDLQPFLTLDIIKLINLMADQERFKR